MENTNIIKLIKYLYFQLLMFLLLLVILLKINYLLLKIITILIYLVIIIYIYYVYKYPSIGKNNGIKITAINPITCVKVNKFSQSIFLKQSLE